MAQYKDMSAEELKGLKAQLEKEYEDFKKKGLRLDMSQGKSGLLFEGIGYSNEYIQTLFNARKFNEYALTRLIYSAFKRTKLKQELSI